MLCFWIPFRVSIGSIFYKSSMAMICGGLMDDAVGDPTSLVAALSLVVDGGAAAGEEAIEGSPVAAAVARVSDVCAANCHFALPATDPGPDPARSLTR